MSSPSNTSIVRRQDGSIDIDHYARRAVILRSVARTEFRVGFILRTMQPMIDAGRRCARRLQQPKAPEKRESARA